jgi:hypothetical protein
VWCDNKVAVSVLTSGRGIDPTLHSIARNLWLFEAACDADITFSHVRGKLNVVADLLSRWGTRKNPTAELFKLLNAVPVWLQASQEQLHLDLNI